MTASANSTRTLQIQRTLRGRGLHATSSVRCAARYAAIAPCSITEAARVFDVGAGGVWQAWARIYPALPQPIDPCVCAACGSEDHVAVRGQCSASGRAMVMVDGGESAQMAAAIVGISPQTVYRAISNRRQREARRESLLRTGWSPGDPVVRR